MSKIEDLVIFKNEKRFERNEKKAWRRFLNQLSVICEMLGSWT